MNNIEETKKISFLEKIKSGKIPKSIIILIAFALIIMMSVFNFSYDKNVSTETDINVYVANLENKLSDVLSKVDGAGSVAVCITLESGLETVLATKTTTTTTDGKILVEETPILVNGKTVTLKENLPKISGVLIVAKGAEKISIKNKLLLATTSLLDVNINQIEILTMK